MLLGLIYTGDNISCVVPFFLSASSWRDVMQVDDEMSPASPAVSPSASHSEVTDPNPIPPEALQAVDPLANLVIKIDADTVDEDGFVSIWNIAATTMGGKTEVARILASKLLGFLCKHRCDFVFTSSTDAKYLDEWFERDTSLLYDWSPQSEKVDVVSQHAQVPAQGLVRFLKEKKFDPLKSYSPRRADRVQWFSDQWCIG